MSKPNRPLGHFEEFSSNFSQINQMIYSFTFHSAYAISLYYFYEKFWPQPQMSTKYSFLESMYVIGHSFLMVFYVQIIIHLSLREHFQMCSSTISHEIFQIFSSISNTKRRKNNNFSRMTKLYPLLYASFLRVSVWVCESEITVFIFHSIFVFTSKCTKYNAFVW